MTFSLDGINTIGGWAAFGLLVGLNIYGFFRDWVVTRGQYSAMKDILDEQLVTAQKAAAAWEKVAVEALGQNTKLLNLGIGAVTTPVRGTRLEVTGGD